MSIIEEVISNEEENMHKYAHISFAHVIYISENQNMAFNAIDKTRALTF